MIDAETTRFIRQEIARQVQIIMGGNAGTNAAVITEDIQEMVPGMPTITKRPVMHPYGFASRAPKKTTQVTARQGEHAGNRVVLGHRAADRPTDLAEGESVQYSVGGYRITVRNDEITLQKGSTVETLVCGEALTSFLKDLIDALKIHTHPSPGAPPTNAATFVSLKTQNLDNDKILAKDGGRF